MERKAERESVSLVFLPVGGYRQNSLPAALATSLVKNYGILNSHGLTLMSCKGCANKA